MTEQQSTAQQINDALANLLRLQAGPAFPGKTHKIAADTANLARLWAAYRNRQEIASQKAWKTDAAAQTASDADFEAQYADELADELAYHDEKEQERALGQGLG